MNKFNFQGVTASAITYYGAKTGDDFERVKSWSTTKEGAEFLSIFLFSLRSMTFKLAFSNPQVSNLELTDFICEFLM